MIRRSLLISFPFFLWASISNSRISISGDEGGGGDFYGYHKGCGEGGPIVCALSPIAGRWAGDRIAFVGDYDSSRLWDVLPEFRNISKELVEEWNAFIELPDLKLTFRPECTHQ